MTLCLKPPAVAGGPWLETKTRSKEAGSIFFERLTKVNRKANFIFE